MVVRWGDMAFQKRQHATIGWLQVQVWINNHTAPYTCMTGCCGVFRVLVLIQVLSFTNYFVPVQENQV